jgi:hypothetical protein
MGAMVSASLRVGQEFNGDPVARDASRIEKFIVRDDGGERALVGSEGRDPAGWFRVERDGGAIIGYRSRPAFLELPPEKFEQYLRDEGLERIIEWRAKHGESQKPSREIYSRCAKSLLNVGKTQAKFDKPLRFRLELVPKTMSADSITVRLLYESKPLEGVLVVALHRDDPSIHLRARSDKSGQVTLSLPKRGVWLIKAVHMIPAPPASNADWESLWASLTFEE